MRDSVKRRYAVAAVILLSSPLLCVDCASASSERAYLIAQADPGQADQGQAGTITPEKIRSVVEITLRQRWQPAALAEGASTEAEFRVTSAGQIEGVSIRNSAGNSDFDRACVAAIEKTAPLPALPSYLGLNQLAFGATFHTGNQPWVELRLLDGAQRSAQNPSNQSQLMQPSAGALQASAGNINEIGTQMGLPEQGANTAPSGGQTGGTSPAANQTQQPSGSGTNDINQRVLSLNNQAVVAINDSNYEYAIKKLEEALKLDPTYKHARENLAIAYNNYGLELKSRPFDALKVFHKALALDPSNEKTKLNLETLIQYMGKNPKSFKDRLDLGNKSLAGGDLVGARIEFEAAMAIKPDPIIQQKLQQLMSGNLPPPVRTNPPQDTQAGGKTHPGKAGASGSTTAGQHAPPGKGTANSTKVPPKHNPISDTTGGGGTQLDTMYRNIKSLETKTFGKTFDSDDILTRLARLETKLLGKPQQGKAMRRLDALLLMQ